VDHWLADGVPPTTPPILRQLEALVWMLPEATLCEHLPTPWAAYLPSLHQSKWHSTSLPVPLACPAAPPIFLQSAACMRMAPRPALNLQPPAPAAL